MAQGNRTVFPWFCVVGLVGLESHDFFFNIIKVLCEREKKNCGAVEGVQQILKVGWSNLILLNTLLLLLFFFLWEREGMFMMLTEPRQLQWSLFYYIYWLNGENLSEQVKRRLQKHKLINSIEMCNGFCGVGPSARLKTSDLA